MSKLCAYCQKQFDDKIALHQHMRSKHYSHTLLLDENVSRGEPAVDQLHAIFEHKLLSFPKTLRGHPDDAVIQFAAKKSTGLVTRDKFCAKKAVRFVSPVYLITHYQNLESIIRLN